MLSDLALMPYTSMIFFCTVALGALLLWPWNWVPHRICNLSPAYRHFCKDGKYDLECWRKWCCLVRKMLLTQFRESWHNSCTTFQETLKWVKFQEILLTNCYIPGNNAVSIRNGFKEWLVLLMCIQYTTRENGECLASVTRGNSRENCLAWNISRVPR